MEHHLIRFGARIAAQVGMDGVASSRRSRWLRGRLRKARLSTFNLVNALVISLLVLLVGMLDIYQRQRTYLEKERILEEQLLDNEKRLLRFAVSNAIDYIRFRQAKVESVIRKELRSRVNEAHRLATGLYGGGLGSKDRILEVLRSMRFNSGRGYYFMYSLDGREVLSFEPAGAGLMPSGQRERVIGELVRIAREQGEGFYSYLWPRPGSGAEAVPKISFVKRFEACGWLIGAGEYVEDIRVETQRDVLKWVSQTRFADNGYLWIHDTDLAMVMHPYFGPQRRPEWYRAGGLRGYQDSAGTHLFVEMLQLCRRQGSGFVSYRWQKPGRRGTSPKLSYVELVPDWNWIVGGGLYTEDLEGKIRQGKLDLARQTRREAWSLAVLIAAALLLSLGSTRFFHLRIAGAFQLFGSAFRKAALAQKKIDPSEQRFLELREMANYVNRLVEDRSSADCKLKEREAQLVQAQKMDAIGRLAGGIAHDFNNLLTAIIGYAELALMRPQQDRTTRDALEEIGRCAESAAGLTQRLLAFSRKQVVEPAVLHLNNIVESFHRILRRIIGENISLVTELDPSLGLLQADQGQIEQVLLNLAVNARDAMPEGGTLRIATRNVAGEESPLQGAAGVLLQISDSGSGMDEATLEHLFEPFFTTKEVGKGTGLGLSTVFGIVKQSGGRLSVESSPGCGATFRLYFPRIQSLPRQETAEAEQVALPAGNGTVLVVEDEEPVRRMIVHTLRGSGYRVLEAAGGHEALRLVEGGRAGPIDLVLTDVIMPDMSGDQLIERLPARLRSVPVLYMSGYSGHRRLDQASLIQKPFSPHTLCLRIRERLQVAREASAPARGGE